MILFDLNGFKRFNDTCGHPAGDALLAEWAPVARTVVDSGVAYRIGGDEFCVVIHLGRATASHGSSAPRRSP